MDMNSKLCRFCMETERNNGSLIDIFKDNKTILIDKIVNCTGVYLSPNDRVPPVLCEYCINFIEKITDFLQTIKKNDEVLNIIYNVSTTEQITVNQADNVNDGKYKSEDAKSELLILNDDLKTKEIHTDDDEDKFVDCHSNVSFNDDNCTGSLLKPSHSNQSNDATIYFSGGKKLRLSENMISDGGITYACSICCKIFYSSFEYHDHLKSHKGKLAFHWSNCSKIFSDRKSLADHENNHKKLYNQYGIQYLAKSLENDMKIHKYENENCDKGHRPKHVGSRQDSYNGFSCSKQNSCQHSKKVHLGTRNSLKLFDCKYCSFSAKSKAVLTVHTSRKHTGQKCGCDMCSKLFKSELSLKQHRIRPDHRKKNKYNGRGKTISEVTLNKYMPRKNFKQKIFECSECLETFFTVKELKSHKRKHEQNCFECPKCGKQFSYRKLMEKHKLKCTKTVRN